MPREPRSPEEKKARRRIAAYVRQRWEIWLKSHVDEDLRTQRAFADKLKLHEGTISKIIKGTIDEAGLDVALALNRELGVDGQSLLSQDPEARFFRGIVLDGRVRRYASKRAGSRESGRAG